MKLLFGYQNFKWLVTEFVKMYSAQDSFFSKKRIESGIGFILLEWGMIYYLKLKIDNIDMTDMLMWAGVQGTICGYMINAIQKEKKPEAPKTEPTGE